MIVFLKCFPASVCCLLPLFALPSCASAAERPNIVVLMADDWSWPHAGSLAKDVPTYADLLAGAGYHTGFSRKGASPSKHTYRGTDPFGPRLKDFKAFLSERKKGAPFCFWYGSGAPHRPYVLDSGKAAGLNPERLALPPGLPDHPTVRLDLLDYYAAVQDFDREASFIFTQLEKEGELENTLVVMSGDNGMPFPRAKATLYDTGTRVPLVVRWGKQVKAGHTVSDFVSLCDLPRLFSRPRGSLLPR